MTGEIKAALNNGNGNAIVYTALIAAIVANCTPTPADALFFYREQVDKELLEKKQITPKQYWVRNTIGYYAYTAGWYALCLTVILSVGGTYQTKAKILLGLISGGLVVGVIAKNIQKDNEIAQAAQ